MSPNTAQRDQLQSGPGTSCDNLLLRHTSCPRRALQVCFSKRGFPEGAKPGPSRPQPRNGTNKHQGGTSWQKDSPSQVELFLSSLAAALVCNYSKATMPGAQWTVLQGAPEPCLDNSPKYAQQPGTHKAPPQAMQELGKMPNPPQITAYIKAQERKAVASMHGFKLGTALLSFCSSMQDLYSTPECEVNCIHISAIITALGRVWPAAQRSPSFQQKDQAQACHNVHVLYHQTLKQLQPMMQGLDAQGISNILLSSAKLGFEPDEYVPGMVRTLAHRFLQLIRAASKKGRPNEQHAANFVWALATMHHAAATDEVLELVCQYFASLIYHPDARQHPKAQGVTNTVWALAELKHVPSSKVASALLDHMVALCQIPGLQPNPQNISNLFMACAKLRLSMPQGQIDVLLKYLLGLPLSTLKYQDYGNVAWSLSVMGMLDIITFDAILDQQTAKRSQLVRERGIKRTSAQPNKEDARQLHQAAEWLKPAEGSEQMEAWSSLHSRLQAVAPEPPHTPRSFLGQAELCDALAAQA